MKHFSNILIQDISERRKERVVNETTEYDTWATSLFYLPLLYLFAIAYVTISDFRFQIACENDQHLHDPENFLDGLSRKKQSIPD